MTLKDWRRVYRYVMLQKNFIGNARQCVRRTDMLLLHFLN